MWVFMGVKLSVLACGSLKQATPSSRPHYQVNQSHHQTVGVLRSSDGGTQVKSQDKSQDKPSSLESRQATPLAALACTTLASFPCALRSTAGVSALAVQGLNHDGLAEISTLSSTGVVT